MPATAILPGLVRAQELPLATSNALGPAVPLELTTSAPAWPFLPAGNTTRPPQNELIALRLDAVASGSATPAP